SAGQIEIFAEEVRESRAHLHLDRMGRAVDSDRDRAPHRGSWQRPTAAASTRSARTAATFLRYSAEAWRSPSGESAAAAAPGPSAPSAGGAAGGPRPRSTAPPAALRTGVAPTPKKPSRACAVDPAPSRERIATQPTRAKSPWRRATSAKPQPAPSGGRAKRAL